MDVFIVTSLTFLSLRLLLPSKSKPDSGALCGTGAGQLGTRFLLGTRFGGPGCLGSPWDELFWGGTGWCMGAGWGGNWSLWFIQKVSERWLRTASTGSQGFPRVPSSAQKGFGVASWRVTSSCCPCVCLAKPKRAHGNQFSPEKWMIHFSLSGLKTPAWLEPPAHICLAHPSGFGKCGNPPSPSSERAFHTSEGCSPPPGRPEESHSRKK